MEPQLIFGILLIFVIFLLICIYVNYVRQIHEGFSSSKTHGFWDHHPLANLWTNHVAHTEDDGTTYDFQIDPGSDKKITSTGFDWEINGVGDGTHIKTNGTENKVSIKGEGGVDIQSGNNSITTDGDVVISSSDSSVKIAPDEITLESKQINLNSVEDISVTNLNASNNITAGEFKLGSDDGVRIGNPEGRDSDIVDGHSIPANNGISISNSSSGAYENVHLGGLYGFNADSNNTYMVDNSGNFTTAGNITADGNITSNDGSISLNSEYTGELDKGDIKANKIYASEFHHKDTNGDFKKLMDTHVTADDLNQVHFNDADIMLEDKRRLCFGSGDNATCFGLEDLKILKGTNYFNIRRADDNEDKPESDNILRCTGKECKIKNYVDEDDTGFTQSKFNKFRIQASSNSSDDGTEELVKKPDPENEALFSNIVNDCCSGSGGGPLNTLMDQCKKNVKKTYDTEDECKLNLSAEVIQGDDTKKTLVCGIECMPKLNNKGKDTGKYKMTGVYDLRSRSDQEASINAARCLKRSKSKYNAGFTCANNLELSEVTIPADDYNTTPKVIRGTNSETPPDSAYCGDFCYRPSTSNGVWEMSIENPTTGNVSESTTIDESLRTIFKSKCSSKFNKRNSSYDSCMDSAAVGEYYLRGDQDKGTYYCGTCAHDEYSTKWVPMDFKVKEEQLKSRRGDSNREGGSILGSQPTDPDKIYKAICEYNQTISFKDKSSVKKYGVGLNDYKDIEEGKDYKNATCTSLYGELSFRKKDKKWKPRFSGEPKHDPYVDSD